jgi:hypothetical protein
VNLSIFGHLLRVIGHWSLVIGHWALVCGRLDFNCIYLFFIDDISRSTTIFASIAMTNDAQQMTND